LTRGARPNTQTRHARPLDLDDQVWNVFVGRIADDVALVRLGPGLTELLLEGPGAKAVQRNIGLNRPHLQQARERLLASFVDPRGAHDLDLAVEIIHTHAGAIAADREDRLEVLPGHRTQGDPLVFLDAWRWQRIDHGSRQPNMQLMLAAYA